MIAEPAPAAGPAELLPLTLDAARRYVAEHHRHNEPPIGHRFSIGLARGGELVGVVMVGRPVARRADDGRTVELLRVTTEGDRNACSRLYAAACRAAGAMGYLTAITYTLPDEDGASLRASGFVRDPDRSGSTTWTNRPGRTTARLRLFDAPLIPVGPKVRWSRSLRP